MPQASISQDELLSAAEEVKLEHHNFKHRVFFLLPFHHKPQALKTHVLGLTQSTLHNLFFLISLPPLHDDSNLTREPLRMSPASAGC